LNNNLILSYKNLISRNQASLLSIEHPVTDGDADDVIDDPFHEYHDEHDLALAGGFNEKLHSPY